MKRMGQLTNCLNCSKGRYFYPSEIRRGRGKYCSTICANQVNNRKRSEKIAIKGECEVCSTKFTVKPSREKRCHKRFCSMKCFSQKVEKTCLICHEKYLVQRWEGNTSKYCSGKCQAISKKGQIGYWTNKKRPNLKLPHLWKSGKDHPYWKGGISRLDKESRHSYEYAQWRKIVLKRDRQCIWCGNKEDLQVDHIKSFREYPKSRFDPNNGRVLCFSCHKTTPSYGFFPKKEGFYA